MNAQKPKAKEYEVCHGKGLTIIPDVSDVQSEWGLVNSVTINGKGQSLKYHLKETSDSDGDTYATYSSKDNEDELRISFHDDGGIDGKSKVFGEFDVQCPTNK